VVGSLTGAGPPLKRNGGAQRLGLVRRTSVLSVMAQGRLTARQTRRAGTKSRSSVRRGSVWKGHRSTD